MPQTNENRSSYERIERIAKKVILKSKFFGNTLPNDEVKKEEFESAVMRVIELIIEAKQGQDCSDAELFDTASDFIFTIMCSFPLPGEERTVHNSEGPSSN